MNTEGFTAWLQRHHYQSTTIKKTLADLKRAPSSDLNVEKALRRYATFAEEAGIADELTELAGHLAPIQRLPHEKPVRRKLEARSFPEEDWGKLTRAVEGSLDPRDQVLWAMATTGLRVGDVLRVPREILNQAVRTGVLEAERKGGTFVSVPLGILEPWLALQRACKAAVTSGVPVSNVAALVADGDPNPDAGGAAYQRVDRRLKAIRRQTGMTGRANTHRLRRTVAVQALEATDNPITVQQMLGNASMNATGRYIDEVNVRRVKDLQQTIHRRK